MVELFLSGGILMYPLLLCSVVALALILEKFWTLRPAKLVPPNLVYELWNLVETKQAEEEDLTKLAQKHILADILVTGLTCAKYGRDIMHSEMETSARQKLHQLTRFMSLLGTIVAIAPLLGLLGTVIGMIEIFTGFRVSVTGSAELVASGIAQALITTACGLTIAIPALFCQRLLLRRLDDIAAEIERQTAILLNLMFFVPTK